MPRIAFWFVCALIIVVGAVASVWFWNEGSATNNTWHAAPVIGSLLVAVGWMVTSLNTIRSSELEYTLTLLGRYRVSAESQSRWEIISDHDPENTVLAPPDGKSDASEDDPVYDAVVGELNESEYIATGALKGVYDNEMLRYDLEPDFLLLYRFAIRYIEFVRVLDGDPEVWAARPCPNGAISLRYCYASGRIGHFVTGNGECRRRCMGTVNQRSLVRVHSGSHLQTRETLDSRGFLFFLAR